MELHAEHTLDLLGGGGIREGLTVEVSSVASIADFAREGRASILVDNLSLRMETFEVMSPRGVVIVAGL